MAMSKEEFKRRWLLNEEGDGIMYNEVADCYEAWGLGIAPRAQPCSEITYAVLRAANVPRG
jgi:hypothetical protein